jgi:hypothetical protein
MDSDGGAHAAPVVIDRPVLPSGSVVGIWAGRLFVLIAAIVVAAALLQHSAWSDSGAGADRIAPSPLASIAFILVLFAGILSPWLSGIAASPQASWREGKLLVSETVVGRRRILIPDARVMGFRVLTYSGVVRGALLIDRRHRVLVLLGPLATEKSAAIIRLVELRTPKDWRRIAAEHLVGLLGVVVVCVATFALLGLACWAMGLT